MDTSLENLYESDMDHARHHPVESYNLFGEQDELPDVVHCETIEARSLLHNWEFRPHRHARLYQILLIESGGGVAQLETGEATLAAGDMVNVPAGFVHGYRFQPGTRGWVVTMVGELVDQTLRQGEGLRQVLGRPAIVRYEPRHLDTVRRIFDEHAAQDFARAHVLRSLSALLLGDMARSLENLDDSNAGKSGGTLRARFEALLEQTYDKHLSVSDYAAMLYVSPTHLSRVLREATGQSATEAITARLMREARRHLFFTNLRVAEIAYLLGYSDPAYFTRVFTRTIGMSPRTFRNRTEGAGSVR